MNKAACVGVGLIGSSWAALLAWKGLTVYIHDLNIEITKRALNEIHKILKLLTDLYGSEPKGEVIISKTLEEAVEDVEYVQESVVEDLKIKKDLFEKIDNISKHEAIIASSTSGLRISEIQRAVKNYPERCLIVHPFNPPHLMPLVEVVPGPETSREVVDKVVDFMKKLGKNPIIVKRDVPGMVANRLQAALWREAINLVVNAVVTPEEVDVAIRYGPGIRWALMGIFLTFHLGGGKSGIKYFMESLEATFENIWNDLASWTEYPENSMATIEERVNEYLKGYDLEKLAEWRDKKIFEILKLIK